MEEWKILLMPMFGALFGSLFTYQFAKYKENRKEILERKRALNFALFVLARQYNALRVQANTFAEITNKYDLAFSLPAFKPPSYDDLKLDLSSLAFLIDESEADMILRLSIEQERFEQAINSVHIRNEFYVNEVQPSMLKHGVLDRDVPVEELGSLLGKRVYSGAIQGGENMRKHVLSTIDSSKKAHEELHTLAKKLYPASKFVKFEQSR